MPNLKFWISKGRAITIVALLHKKLCWFSADDTNIALKRWTVLYVNLMQIIIMLNYFL